MLPRKATATPSACRANMRSPARLSGRPPTWECEAHFDGRYALHLRRRRRTRHGLPPAGLRSRAELRRARTGPARCLVVRGSGSLTAGS